MLNGVPQGSVMGSVVFPVFILMTLCYVKLYADDTILFCYADSDYLKLVPNVRKTTFLLLCYGTSLLFDILLSREIQFDLCQMMS